MRRRFSLPLWLEIALAVLIALALSNLVTIVLFRSEGERRLVRFGAEMLGQRVAGAADIVLRAPNALKPDLVKALSGPDMRLSLDAEPAVAEGAVRDNAMEAAIGARLTSAPTHVRAHNVTVEERLSRPPPPPSEGAAVVRPPEPQENLIVSIEVGTGEVAPSQWLNARVGLGMTPGRPPGGFVVSIGGGTERWFNAPPPPPPPPGSPGDFFVSTSGGVSHSFEAPVAGVTQRFDGSVEGNTQRLAAPVGGFTQRLDGPVLSRPPSWPLLWSGAAVIAALLLVSLWIGGRVTRPLQRLAEAAVLLRRGEFRAAVPETGPAPVREAARAFNAMSKRVMAMLKGQRAMMVAVAHDLRTPIAVLRFRVELLSDEEARAKLVETLDEMQAMTESVLDAVRFDGTGEAARAVDVAVLTESLCADMAEVGGDVLYRSDAVLNCTCRAAEVRRAVRNLIENALRYGVRARVSAQARDGNAEIIVDDEGPGIPEGELERVFEPFARLDESRNKETGGHGLGLSIARLIARGHGGDVALENRAGGGVRATLTLPLG